MRRPAGWLSAWRLVDECEPVKGVGPGRVRGQHRRQRLEHPPDRIALVLRQPRRGLQRGPAGRQTRPRWRTLHSCERWFVCVVMLPFGSSPLTATSAGRRRTATCPATSALSRPSPCRRHSGQPTCTPCTATGFANVVGTQPRTTSAKPTGPTPSCASGSTTTKRRHRVDAGRLAELRTSAN
jgi:hypothetical protein